MAEKEAARTLLGEQHMRVCGRSGFLVCEKPDTCGVGFSLSQKHMRHHLKAYHQVDNDSSRNLFLAASSLVSSEIDGVLVRQYKEGGAKNGALPPIDGLPCLKGKICALCDRIFVNDKTLSSHLSREHRGSGIGVASIGMLPTVLCQSLGKRSPRLVPFLITSPEHRVTNDVEGYDPGAVSSVQLSDVEDWYKSPFVSMAEVPERLLEAGLNLEKVHMLLGHSSEWNTDSFRETLSAVKKIVRSQMDEARVLGKNCKQFYNFLSVIQTSGSEKKNKSFKFLNVDKESERDIAEGKVPRDTLQRYVDHLSIVVRVALLVATHPQEFEDVFMDVKLRELAIDIFNWDTETASEDISDKVFQLLFGIFCEEKGSGKEGSAGKIFSFVVCATLCVHHDKQGRPKFSNGLNVGARLAGILYGSSCYFALYLAKYNAGPGWKDAMEKIRTVTSPLSQHGICYMTDLRSICYYLRQEEAKLNPFERCEEHAMCGIFNGKEFSAEQYGDSVTRMHAAIRETMFKGLFNVEEAPSWFWESAWALVEDADKNILGYWALSDERNSSIVQRCVDWAKSAANLSGLRQDGWTVWKGKAEEMFLTLITAMHISGGGPGRGTEVGSLLLRTTSFSRRNIYFPKDEVMIVPFYSKTRGLRQGKLIMLSRHLDKVTSGLFRAFFLLVHPLLVLEEERKCKGENKSMKSVFDLRDKINLGKWHPRKMSEEIGRKMAEFDIPFKFSEFRHHQRGMVMCKGDDSLLQMVADAAETVYKETDEEFSVHQAAIAQAGHSAMSAKKFYAHLSKTKSESLKGGKSRVESFRCASKEWHKDLGLVKQLSGQSGMCFKNYKDREEGRTLEGGVHTGVGIGKGISAGHHVGRLPQTKQPVSELLALKTPAELWSYVHGKGPAVRKPSALFDGVKLRDESGQCAADSVVENNLNVMETANIVTHLKNDIAPGNAAKDVIGPGISPVTVRLGCFRKEKPGDINKCSVAVPIYNGMSSEPASLERDVEESERDSQGTPASLTQAVNDQESQNNEENPASMCMEPKPRGNTARTSRNEILSVSLPSARASGLAEGTTGTQSAVIVATPAREDEADIPPTKNAHVFTEKKSGSPSAARKKYWRRFIRNGQDGIRKNQFKTRKASDGNGTITVPCTDAQLVGSKKSSRMSCSPFGTVVRNNLVSAEDQQSDPVETGCNYNIPRPHSNLKGMPEPSQDPSCDLELSQKVKGSRFMEHLRPVDVSKKACHDYIPPFQNSSSPVVFNALGALRKVTTSQALFNSIEQKRAMEAVAARRGDLLIILATGQGKTAVAMAPMLSETGVSVWICPLRALRWETERRLSRGGVEVHSLNSITVSRSRNAVGMVLLVSLEDVAQPRFQRVIDQLQARDSLNRFVLDEAHLAALAESYRPCLKLLKSGTRLGTLCPLVMLTATAPPPMVFRIASMCGSDVDGLEEHRGDPCRPNLSLSVEYLKNEETETLFEEVVSRVKKARDKYETEPVRLLIVCITIQDCIIIHKQLAASRMFNVEDVLLYHSKRSEDIKSNVMKRWQSILSSGCRVVVATEGFSIGTDAPNVRLVVFAGACRNVVDYWQGAGRAGRDGGRGEVLTLYHEKHLIRGRGGKEDLEISDCEREAGDFGAWARNKTECRRLGIERCLSGEMEARSCSSRWRREEKVELCDICLGKQKMHGEQWFAAQQGSHHENQWKPTRGVKRPSEKELFHSRQNQMKRAKFACAERTWLRNTARGLRSMCLAHLLDMYGKKRSTSGRNVASVYKVSTTCGGKCEKNVFRCHRCNEIGHKADDCAFFESISIDPRTGLKTGDGSCRECRLNSVYGFSPHAGTEFGKSYCPLRKCLHLMFRAWDNVDIQRDMKHSQSGLIWGSAGPPIDRAQYAKWLTEESIGTSAGIIHGLRWLFQRLPADFGQHVE